MVRVHQLIGQNEIVRDQLIGQNEIVRSQLRGPLESEHQGQNAGRRPPIACCLICLIPYFFHALKLVPKKNVRKYLALNVIRGQSNKERVKVERCVPINVRSVHSAVLADIVWLKNRARWRRACRHCLENRARLTKLTAVAQPTRAAGSAFWREGSVGKI